MVPVIVAGIAAINIRIRQRRERVTFWQATKNAGRDSHARTTRLAVKLWTGIAYAALALIFIIGISQAHM